MWWLTLLSAVALGQLPIERWATRSAPATRGGLWARCRGLGWRGMAVTGPLLIGYGGVVCWLTSQLSSSSLAPVIAGAGVATGALVRWPWAHTRLGELVVFGAWGVICWQATLTALVVLGLGLLVAPDRSRWVPVAAVAALPVGVILVAGPLLPMLTLAVAVVAIVAWRQRHAVDTAPDPEPET